MANRRTSFGGNLIASTLESEEVTEKKLSFEKGLKIAADNKINGNNTWDLALIDYFADMTLLRDGEGINFQKASYTLDGCVKVYTSRIDSFEMETRKLLLGLADKSTGNGLGGVESEVAVGEDGSNQSKRRKQLATTLEDNASLTTDALELDFAADPLFQKTAADFDEGGAKGLLLSHLDISKTGKIIFDASDVVSNDLPPTLPVSADIDIAGLMAKFGSKFSNMESREICPTFSSFLFNSDAVQDFNIGTINTEDYYFNEVDDDDMMMSDYEDLPNEMYQLGPNQEKLFLPPVPQIDDFNDDYGNFEDAPMAFDDDEDGMSVAGNASGQVGESLVQKSQTTFVRESGFLADENAFRLYDAVPGRNWAGPQFWKSRSLKTTIADPSAAKSFKQPAKKKDKVSIDFVNGPRLERAKVFAKSSTSTTLPKSKTKALNNELHLLPDDLQFNSERLLKLFLKPHFKIRNVLESIMSFKEPGESGNNSADPSQSIEEENEDFIYTGFDEVDDEVPDDLPSTIPSGFGILSGDSDPSLVQTAAPMSSPNDFSAEFNDDYGSMDEFSPAANLADSQQEGALINSQESCNSALLKKPSMWEDVKPKFRQKTIPLFFARTAKRVDVAKLKENLWHKMVDNAATSPLVDAEQEDKENISNTSKSLQKQQRESIVEEDEKMNFFQEPKQFTHIVSELDECYEEKARKDISVAFCFICVLHLANENNLKITSEGMRELVIASNS